MIDDLYYSVKSKSGNNTIPLLQPNLDGLVHAQIMRATMRSASMYTQLNFIVGETR